METVKEILVPISAIITLLSIAIGSLVAVFAYRVNSKAETRLKESTKAEIDVKLLGLMINLVEKANGRNGNEISDEVVKKIFESEKISKLDLLENNNSIAVKKLLNELSIFSMPVGSGEQVFAIQAIAELGLQHTILKEISLASLRKLKRSKISEILCNELIELLEKS